MSEATIDELFFGKETIDSDGKRWGQMQPFDLEEMPPNILYHYTTATGVVGILENSMLRATNYSFLNDPSELLYGRDLVHKVLKELHRQGNGLLERLFEKIRTTLDEQLSEVYLCCFSKCRDDLSQWRAYGGSAAERYCIGFDIEKSLTPRERQKPKTQARRSHSHAYRNVAVTSSRLTEHVDSVIYNEEHQCGKIRKLITVAIAHPEDEAVAERAAYHLARLLPRIKDPVYFREEEWRIIRWQLRDTSNEDLCFDSSSGIVRPFVKVQFLKPLPIAELIVLAPSRKDVSVKAANMLLRKCGVMGIEAEHSKVPFNSF
jgi:Protein of unknown function (DUF2971)